MKFLISFCSIILIVFFTSHSYGALIVSTGDGNWDDTGTWDLGRLPQDGDEILIDAGHTVSLITEEVLNNVTIAVRGNLRFYRQWVGPGFFDWLYGQLTLDANSVVVVEDTGDIISDSILDFANIIEIDGVDQWSGNDGDLTGPATVDTVGTQPGTPPGYVPLPIELISFRADLAGQVVEISWATAAEINNDFFTLELSDNGADWGIIGEEDGAGNSTLRLDYSFIDYNPIPGLSYYRLKQTDYDGQFEYFDPAVVLYEPDNLFKVFPNPTTDYLKISTSSDLSKALINIKNLNGQTKITEIPSSAHQATVDISSLSEGVYLLEIVFPESVLSRRIIKK